MPEEFTCPVCRTPLEQMRLEHGVFWACAQCGGRALSVKLLRRTFAKSPSFRHAKLRSSRRRSERASHFRCGRSTASTIRR